jgi:hypothetical protein
MAHQKYLIDTQMVVKSLPLFMTKYSDNQLSTNYKAILCITQHSHRQMDKEI